MSAIGACAPLVEAEAAVARTTGAAAATAEMGAQAVTTDLPPRLHTEIAAGIAEIATAQVISTRAITVVEGTAQGRVEHRRQAVAVIVGQVEGSRTNRDPHRAHLIRVLPHHHSLGPAQDHNP